VSKSGVKVSIGFTKTIMCSSVSSQNIIQYPVFASPLNTPHKHNENPPRCVGKVPRLLHSYCNIWVCMVTTRMLSSLQRVTIWVWNTIYVVNLNVKEFQAAGTKIVANVGCNLWRRSRKAFLIDNNCHAWRTLKKRRCRGRAWRG